MLGDVFTILTYTGTRNGFFAENDHVFLQGRKFGIVYDDSAKEIRLTKVKANLTINIIPSSIPDAVWGQGTSPTNGVTFTIVATGEPGANPIAPQATVEITLTGPLGAGQQTFGPVAQRSPTASLSSTRSTCSAWSSRWAVT